MINIINVYGPHDIAGKNNMWWQLSHILHQIDDEKLCILGDFNAVRNQEERKDCLYRKMDSVNFNSFITDNNLIDVQAGDGIFTWFGPSGKRSKLDRILLNSSWVEGRDWDLKYLHMKSSDHKALFLEV